MADGRLVRVKLAFERDFTQIPNEWLRDNMLSLRARGLLALLMSHNAGFVVTHKQLVATNPEGHTAIQSAVDELKQRGYLDVVKERGRGGRIDGWVWTLTDPAERKSRSTPHLDIPDLDNGDAAPDLRYPDLDNPRLKEAHSEEQLITRETVGSTHAGVNEDALTRAIAESRVAHMESSEERYQRLLHQPCPFRKDGKEHARFGAESTCTYCGITPGQFWDGKLVRRFDELVQA